MKLVYLIFFLQFIPIKLNCDDLTQIFIIDSISSNVKIYSELDSLIFTDSIEGEIYYKEGKLHSGKIKFHFGNDSLLIFQTPEIETYIAQEECYFLDTLLISFDKTFYNPRNSGEEPNYTLVSKICYKGYDFTSLLPSKVNISENDVIINTQFKLNLNKIYSKINYLELEIDEIYIKLNINAFLPKQE